MALCDQWYISYDNEAWKQKIRQHVEDEKSFRTYTDNVRRLFMYTVNWLREWGCSRSFGEGTLLPWDKQYLIESLSDSTVYFAYYTIVHYLQGLFKSYFLFLSIR